MSPARVPETCQRGGTYDIHEAFEKRHVGCFETLSSQEQGDIYLSKDHALSNGIKENDDGCSYVSYIQKNAAIEATHSWNT